MKAVVELEGPAVPSNAVARPEAALDRSSVLLIWPIAILLFALPVFIQERTAPESRSPDFVYFYAASQVIHDLPIENLYKPGVLAAACQRILPLRDAASSYGPSPYPPFVALLFKPASNLPFWTAFRIHQAVSFALYALGLVILLRSYLPGQPILTNIFFPFAIAYLPWVANTLLNGQVSAFGFFAIAVALAQQESRHPFRSGLALSLCLYKPTLLVLLLPMLFLRRQLRTLAGFAVGGVILVATAAFAFSWSVWSAYARLVFALGSLEKLRQLPQFVDLVAFFSSMAGEGAGWLLALFCSAAALAGLIVMWRRGKGPDRLAWASAISGTLILSPYVPLYDTILIIPSLIISAKYLRFQGKNALPAILLLVFVSAWVSAALAAVVHVQVLTVAIGAVGFMQVSIALRRQLG